MARRLVECIPNFSEGRRMEVVEAIAGAIGWGVAVCGAQRWRDKGSYAVADQITTVALVGFGGTSLEDRCQEAVKGSRPAVIDSSPSGPRLLLFHREDCSRAGPRGRG